VTHQQGVFCANFGLPVLGLPECQNAWCARCYATLPGKSFLIYHETNEDGYDMTAPGEENDYLSAHPGEHHFCPFECDTCAFFQLMQRRLPNLKSRINNLLLTYIRRANLDSFWSQRPGTVQGMRRLFFAQAEVGDLLWI
jgi:hypothetical protein